MRRVSYGLSVRVALLAMIGLGVGACDGVSLEELLSGSGIDININVSADGNSNDGDGCRLEGELESGVNHALASGTAKFEKRDDRLTASVEVEDLAAEFIGTDATVSVDGLDLGTVEIVCTNPLAAPACTLGGFDLNLDSGEGDFIPDLVGADGCSNTSVMFMVTDLNGDMIGAGTMSPKDVGDSGSNDGGGDDDRDDSDNSNDIDANDGGSDGDNNDAVDNADESGDDDNDVEVDRCRLEGELEAGANHALASGTAKFEKRNDRLTASVEVEDLAAEFIGTEASVMAGGVELGTIEIVCINPLDTPACTLGGFDLNLDSRDGDTVPDFVGMDACADVSVMFSVADSNGDMIGGGTMTEDGSGDSTVAGVASVDDCRVEGELNPGDVHPFASGKGKFEKENDLLKISVEVEDLAADFIGTDASVSVGGEDLGTIEIVCINPLDMPACTLGGFDLNLDSGEGDTVPDLVGMDSCSDVVITFTVTDLNGDMIGTGTMMSGDGGDSGGDDGSDNDGMDDNSSGDDGSNDDGMDDDSSNDDGSDDDGMDDGSSDDDSSGDDGSDDGDANDDSSGDDGSGDGDANDDSSDDDGTDDGSADGDGSDDDGSNVDSSDDDGSDDS